MTELEPSTEGTLRQQLEQHAVDPACSGCHLAMDPPGFALEHFDPIGRYRELDNGLPIDATGDIDGVPFDGALQLGQVVAESEKYAECMTTQLYRFANAQVDRTADLAPIAEITERYRADGERWAPLVHALVQSDAFLLATGPAGDACEEAGAERDCATACGAGTETCTDGRWQGCTAAAPGVETCNGVDDDCDGIADDDLEQSCEADFGLGTATCEAGVWGTCSGPGPAEEVCNGADDDLDGEVDEGLQIAVTGWTYDELTTLGHYACDPVVDAFSPACHAAANRACAGTGCAVTGVGPVSIDAYAETLEVSCLDATEAELVNTTFTTLSGHHDGCTIDTRQGGACNAAIHRMCGASGQVTGFGPVENSGDDATVVCTPQAVVLDGSYSTLSTYDAGCNATTRIGVACNHAMHEWCRSQGYATGHGPLENFDDYAAVACMGVL